MVWPHVLYICSTIHYIPCTQYGRFSSNSTTIALDHSNMSWNTIDGILSCPNALIPWIRVCMDSVVDWIILLPDKSYNNKPWRLNKKVALLHYISKSIVQILTTVTFTLRVLGTTAEVVYIIYKRGGTYHLDFLVGTTIVIHVVLSLVAFRELYISMILCIVEIKVLVNHWSVWRQTGTHCTTLYSSVLFN